MRKNAFTLEEHSTYQGVIHIVDERLELVGEDDALPLEFQGKLPQRLQPRRLHGDLGEDEGRGRVDEEELALDVVVQGEVVVEALWMLIWPASSLSEPTVSMRPCAL